MNLSIWHVLQIINQKITSIYEDITSRIIGNRCNLFIIYIPWKRMYIRPYFLHEIYMALGLWEPYINKILKPLKGDFVIDIGAHIGYYTLKLAKAVGHKGLVISIEPDPYNFKILKRNIKVNKLNNVILINCALGSYRGQTSFKVDSKHLISEIIQDSYTSGIKVKINKLDEICKQLNVKKLDWVKIDVEGGASDVLKGGYNILNKGTKMIIEVPDETTLRVLIKLGYSFKQLIKSKNNPKFGYYYAWINND